MIDLIYYLMIIVGLCSSLLGSLLGVGGGFINVPAIIFLGYPNNSTAISLFGIIFNGISASIFNHRKKMIDYKLALLFIPNTILGGIFGVFLFNYIISIDVTIFKLIFTLFLIILGLKIYFKKNNQEDEERLRKVEDFDSKKIIYGIIIGFAIGFFGSFLGIGGGTIAVPTFIFAFDVSTHVAIATSLFTMIFTSSSGLLTYYTQGNINSGVLWLGISLAVGVLIGSNIGSRLAYKLESKKLRKIYGIIMVCVAIPLTWLRMFIPADPIQVFIEDLIKLFSNIGF